jgi:hypothetical protein
MQLRELQGAVGAFVLGRDGAGATPLVLADGLTAEGRLGAYRNNTIISLTEALKATFPVVCRLVSERFFAYAVDAFIRRHPPTGPCVSEYGGELPDFLAAFEPVRQLPYLADVARLEWAINVAYHAADMGPLDPASLAALPPERSASVTFVLHPCSGLVASPYPVRRIWDANQTDGDGRADLDAGACRLLVCRLDRADAPGFSIIELSLGEHTFLRALADGKALGEAGQAATAEDKTFDLAATLSACFSRSTFVEVGFAGSTEGRAP